MGHATEIEITIFYNSFDELSPFLWVSIMDWGITELSIKVSVVNFLLFWGKKPDEVMSLYKMMGKERF